MAGREPCPHLISPALVSFCISLIRVSPAAEATVGVPHNPLKTIPPPSLKPPSPLDPLHLHPSALSCISFGAARTQNWEGGGEASSPHLCGCRPGGWWSPGRISSPGARSTVQERAARHSHSASQPPCTVATPEEAEKPHRAANCIKKEMNKHSEKRYSAEVCSECICVLEMVDDIQITQCSVKNLWQFSQNILNISQNMLTWKGPITDRKSVV